MYDVSQISALMTKDVRYEDPGAPAAFRHGTACAEQYATVAFIAVRTRVSTS
jgi:hypothetical protein